MHQAAAPVLPTDGNLRRSVGDLAMEPHPLLMLASCCPLGLLYPPTPPFPHLLSPSRKNSLSVAQTGPRTQLQAVEASVC